MSVQFKFAYHTGRGAFYENKMQAKQVEIDYCKAHESDVMCLGPNALLAVMLASDDGGHTWYVVASLSGPVNFIEIK